MPTYLLLLAAPVLLGFEEILENFAGWAVARITILVHVYGATHKQQTQNCANFFLGRKN